MEEGCMNRFAVPWTMVPPTVFANTLIWAKAHATQKRRSRGLQKGAGRAAFFMGGHPKTREPPVFCIRLHLAKKAFGPDQE